MKKVAIFVDAGYLFSGGSFSVFDSHKKRSEVSIKIQDLVNHLKNYCTENISSPFLRIYWYDGALPTGLSIEQQKVSQIPGILFRKGYINEKNEQKGIDTHIVAELLELSYKGIIDEAIIIACDSDLAIGVEYAQKLGVKVSLMTVSNIGISQDLKNQVDTITEIPVDILKNLFYLHNNDDLQKDVSVLYHDIVDNYLNNLNEETKEEFVTHIVNCNSLPPLCDRELLKIAAGYLKRQLTTSEKHILRDKFIKYLKN